MRRTLGLAAAVLISLLPGCNRLAWWQLDPKYRPIAQHTLAAAAKMFGTTPARQKALTYPVVSHRQDSTCIQLRTWRRDGAGTYSACYDDSDGHVVEERAEVGF